MSLNRRFQKLRKMSPGEVRTRIGEGLYRWRERRRYRCQPAAKPTSAENLLRAAVAVVPGTRPEEIERLQREFPQVHQQMANRATATARKILSGKWALLGHPVDLRGDVDWHCDPRSEHRWPRTFYADVPLGSPTDETLDVKYVWELGRQQYVVDLARGWLFTGELRYAGRARELMLDWIDENPVYEGVHWTSALEVAMRAVSWLWTTASLAEWEGWHDGDLARIAASLTDHATYLENHLSFYSSPYNHLIGEAAGLYLIGTWMKQSGQSARWRRLGRQVLTEHGPRQFYADGFCVEQAVGYHFYTLGFMTLAVAAARTQREPLDGVEAAIRKAYRAAIAFRQPNGRWPAVGDLDSARAIPVYHDDFWNFDSLCTMGAVLFDDPKLRVAEASAGEEMYWLLGCSAVEKYNKLPETEPPKCVVLEDSGYAVAGQGGDWLLFDAGPLGDGLHADATPSTAHGHADTLQVLYCSAGKPLLLDAGMPFYVGPAEWMRHFRGPAAHNTLEIEEAAAARPAGRLDWTHVAARPRLNANLSDDVWLARGRAEWAPGVVVERNLLGLPGRGLWIADWIETDRPRHVRWFWQMPAGTLRDGSDATDTSCLLRGDDIVLATWADSLRIRLQVESPTKDSPIGLSALHYGSWSAGQRVCHEVDVANRALVVTYVGASPVPVEVTTRGHRVVCHVAQAGDGGSIGRVNWDGADEQCDADERITWRVSTGETQLVYVGGATAAPSDPDQTALTGAGDWPAFATELSACIVTNSDG
ncbi:MAG: alginate lyase family protein [Candidatus Nealsonbacteria bacterium]|nr:alginate lyase family protein [Candidatus Nealsonbacteria bacterium]